MEKISTMAKHKKKKVCASPGEIFFLPVQFFLFYVKARDIQGSTGLSEKVSWSVSTSPVQIPLKDKNKVSERFYTVLVLESSFSCQTWHNVQMFSNIKKQSLLLFDILNIFQILKFFFNIGYRKW